LELKKSDLLEIYRQMVLTRIFDIKTNEWYLQGLLKECVHQSTGQEAISIGSCYGLRLSDQVEPSLRTRGVFFAKGVSPRTVLLTMVAKKGSPSKGHETSHHSCYPELGILPSTGMVGSSISIGVGAALAIKLKKTDDIVLNFFGDGASNRGDFHEAINLAAVWKLPCIFILENNQIAYTTSLQKSTLCERLSDRAHGYGIPGYTIDGNNVIEVYEYVQNAIKRARKGEGPTLLECITFRIKPHVGYRIETRSKEIINKAVEKCPIRKLEKYLIDNRMAQKKELEDISNNLEKEIDEAFESIQNVPSCTPKDMLMNVYEKGSVIVE